jgi:hypothetical protein
MGRFLMGFLYLVRQSCGRFMVGTDPVVPNQWRRLTIFEEPLFVHAERIRVPAAQVHSPPTACKARRPALEAFPILKSR